MTTTTDMLADESRHGAIVRRAQEIIDGKLAVMSTRAALVDLCGSDLLAEALAETHDGYDKALEAKALMIAGIEGEKA